MLILENLIFYKDRAKKIFLNSLLIILSFVFISNSVEAKAFLIKSVYFSDTNSLVLDLDSQKSDSGKPETSEISDGKFLLKDTKLEKFCPRIISNSSYEIHLENKSEASFFNSKNTVYLNVRPLRGEKKISLQGNLLIDSVAYEIKIIPSNEIVDKKLKSGIRVNNLSFYNFSSEKTVAENFLDSLDPNIVKDLVGKTDFQKKLFDSMDSASLYTLGSSLLELGKKSQALEAFREALKSNPDNLSAKLALAKNTDDREEKIQNYIASIDSGALVSVSNAWFDEGIKTKNSLAISSAKIPYELAIIKEPLRADLRLDYALKLEEAGTSYYPEATQRYLEAASLYKKDFISGKKENEEFLRISAESLIKLLSLQGRFDEASKYTLSYLSLGFEKFMDGTPSKAFIKEFERGKNPFRGEERRTKVLSSFIQNQKGGRT